MALADMVTLTREEVLEMVEAMLQRPQMYAQNAGSLEDQVLGLLELIWNKESSTWSDHNTNTLCNQYLKYNWFLKKNWISTSIASKFSTQNTQRHSDVNNDRVITETAQHLKGFVESLKNDLQNEKD